MKLTQEIDRRRCSAGLLVLGLGATAQAQESPPPVHRATPAAPARHSSGSGGGGAGIGVGAAQSIASSGPVAAVGQFVYDHGHVAHRGPAWLRQRRGRPAATGRPTVVFGAGGWYHLHQGLLQRLLAGWRHRRRHDSRPGRIRRPSRRSSRAPRSARSSPRTSRLLRARRSGVRVRRHRQRRHRDRAGRPGRPAPSAPPTSSGRTVHAQVRKPTLAARPARAFLARQATPEAQCRASGLD